MISVDFLSIIMFLIAIIMFWYLPDLLAEKRRANDLSEQRNIILKEQNKDNII